MNTSSRFEGRLAAKMSAAVETTAGLDQYQNLGDYDTFNLEFGSETQFGSETPFGTLPSIVEFDFENPEVPNIFNEMPPWPMQDSVETFRPGPDISNPQSMPVGGQSFGSATFLPRSSNLYHTFGIASFTSHQDDFGEPHVRNMPPPPTPGTDNLNHNNLTERTKATRTRISEEEWEIYRPNIKRLFIDEGNTLEKTMSIMKDVYGFVGS